VRSAPDRGLEEDAVSRDRIIAEAEGVVQDLAAAITAPRDRECLPCYLDRVLHEVSCDGTHALTRRYRDSTAPAATALLRRLSRAGGYCDCEVLLNVYWATSDHVAPCEGVRLGSTQPCDLWFRRRRGMW
jgi:hypothetical protein